VRTGFPRTAEPRPRTPIRDSCDQTSSTRGKAQPVGDTACGAQARPHLLAPLIGVAKMLPAKLTCWATTSPNVAPDSSPTPSPNRKERTNPRPAFSLQLLPLIERILVKCRRHRFYAHSVNMSMSHDIDMFNRAPLQSCRGQAGRRQWVSRSSRRGEPRAIVAAAERGRGSRPQRADGRGGLTRGGFYNHFASRRTRRHSPATAMAIGSDNLDRAIAPPGRAATRSPNASTGTSPPNTAPTSSTAARTRASPATPATGTRPPGPLRPRVLAETSNRLTQDRRHPRTQRGERRAHAIATVQRDAGALLLSRAVADDDQPSPMKSSKAPAQTCTAALGAAR